MTILTNLMIFFFTVFCFKKLNKYNHSYPKDFARFILLVGFSSLVGSFAHGAHYQLGDAFFNVDFYIMNALSLLSVYFCFMGPYVYYNLGKEKVNKTIPYFVIAWIVFLLLFTLIKNNFVIVKIQAGLVLIYSLIVHILIYKRTKEKGSKMISIGIAISFLSIIVHSLKFSISEWFNYKDIAHVIILVSLFYIYKGVEKNSEKLQKVKL